MGSFVLLLGEELKAQWSDLPRAVQCISGSYSCRTQEFLFAEISYQTLEQCSEIYKR